MWHIADIDLMSALRSLLGAERTHRCLAVTVVASILFGSPAMSGDVVTGEVVAVDTINGTIEIRHTVIEQPGLNLPAGKDRFRAQSDLFGGMIFNALRPGDAMQFHAARVKGELTLTDVDRAN